MTAEETADAGSRLSVGVDIGGTKILAGVVDPHGEVLAHVRTDTPPRSGPPSMVGAAAVGLVTQLRASYDVQSVGIAAAGFVDIDGVVAFAPHLPWRREPVREELAARLGLPVVVDNDANAAALAEHAFGAARGAKNLVCLTLGTGIGGAVVLDGEARRGSQGFAGEFGHWPMEPDGRSCPCGQRGCWEQYCSGTAVARAAADLDGVPPGVLGSDVTQAAWEGKAWAVAAFQDVGSWLGQGLAGVCAAIDPELVVVGGGLAEAGEVLLEPARVVLARRLVGATHRRIPPVTQAALGELAGMVGAAELSRIALDAQVGPSAH